jgi:hypothetical protein
MNEHPILFSRKMVQAILAGKKSQTRRIVKQDPQGKIPFTDELPCPYGHTGDFLWVRETFAQYPDGFIFKADFPDDGFGSGIVNLKTGDNYPLVWKPSIHMPRKASRLLLEITELRIERLNNISESDAIDEGATPSMVGGDLDYLKYRAGFQTLWNSINAERGYSWESNPFVWVVSFQIARGLTKREPDVSNVTVGVGSGE